MKATEFCKFFEFTLYKEHGLVPESDELYGGQEYNYIAIDDQGCFYPRYEMNINNFIDDFDSCLHDYIDINIEEDGFEYDNRKEGAYYEQALIWLKKQPYYPQIFIEVVEALTKRELEDDT